MNNQQLIHICPLMRRIFLFKIKALENLEVCKKNDRLKGTVFRLFFIM